MRRLRRSPSKGAAAVEFALVLPLLMLLVLGSIDYGYYFFLDHVVTNAAREGARAGTLWPDCPSSGIKSSGDATQTAQNYLTRAGLNPTAAGSSYTIVPQSVGFPVANGINVHVVYPAGALTGFTPYVPTTVGATSVMRCQ